MQKSVHKPLSNAQTAVGMDGKSALAVNHDECKDENIEFDCDGDGAIITLRMLVNIMGCGSGNLFPFREFEQQVNLAYEMVNLRARFPISLVIVHSNVSRINVSTILCNILYSQMVFSIDLN